MNSGILKDKNTYLDKFGGSIIACGTIVTLSLIIVNYLTMTSQIGRAHV